MDVLHYCMYADKHIATNEDEVIKTAAHKLDWDPKVSYEYYDGQSTALIRAALADSAKRSAFLSGLNSRLGNTGKLIALQLAERVINADGVRKAAELEAIAALREVLSFEAGKR